MVLGIVRPVVLRAEEGMMMPEGAMTMPLEVVKLEVMVLAAGVGVSMEVLLSNNFHEIPG